MVHQWLCSAISDSQQPTSPIGFLFFNFRHRLVKYYWYLLYISPLHPMISLEVSLNHDKPRPRYILTCQGCGSTRPQSTGTPRSSPCDSLDMADPWKLDRADCCSNNMHVYALHCSVYFGVSIPCDLVELDLQCNSMR